MNGNSIQQYSNVGFLGPTIFSFYERIVCVPVFRRLFKSCKKEIEEIPEV
jgi:hypothetical protein